VVACIERTSIVVIFRSCRPRPIEVLMYEDSAEGHWEKIAEIMNGMKRAGRTEDLALIASIFDRRASRLAPGK
jgi:hypothetical protein